MKIGIKVRGALGAALVAMSACGSVALADASLPPLKAILAPKVVARIAPRRLYGAIRIRDIIATSNYPLPTIGQGVAGMTSGGAALLNLLCTPTGDGATCTLATTQGAGSTATPQYTRIQDGTTTNLAAVSSAGVLLEQPASTSGSAVQIGQQADATGNASVLLFGASLNSVYNNASWDRQRSRQGALAGSNPSGVTAVTNEPNVSTYTGSSIAAAPSTSGAFYAITGSSTKTVRIRRCTVTGTAGTATLSIISAAVDSAITGGTTGTAPTVGTLDSVNSTATATAAYYSTPPTGVTVSAYAGAQEMLFTNVTTAAPQTVTFDWGNSHNDQAPTLRGTSQFFTLSTSAALTSPAVSSSCEWTEE